MIFTNTGVQLHAGACIVALTSFQLEGLVIVVLCLLQVRRFTSEANISVTF